MNGKMNAYANTGFSFVTKGERNVRFILFPFSQKKCAEYLEMCDICITHTHTHTHTHSHRH